MTSQGPKNGSTFVNTGSGKAWTGPEGAQYHDTLRATDTLGFGAPSTQYLKATGFGFTIPTNATITGVLVAIERRQVYQEGALDRITDLGLYLVKAGAAVGVNKAVYVLWPLVEAYDSYGAANDLWGTTWTPAEINASDFGFMIAAYDAHPTTLMATASINHIRITVYYSVVTPHSKTYGIDVVLRKLGVMPFGADIGLKGLARSKDFKMDVGLRESDLTIANLIDACLVERHSVDHTVAMIIREPGGTVPARIDAVLAQVDKPSGLGIDILLGAVAARSKESEIAAALKRLSLSELCDIGAVLQRPGLMGYNVDAIVALRTQVLLALDAAIGWSSSKSFGVGAAIAPLPLPESYFGIGAYLINQEKFDITVSFEQFSVEPSFEGFDVTASFESLEVTPYFQEV